MYTGKTFRTRLAGDDGSATAEYAIATMATVVAIARLLRSGHLGPERKQDTRAETSFDLRVCHFVGERRHIGVNIAESEPNLLAGIIAQLDQEHAH
jgi:hypothetical protein